MWSARQSRKMGRRVAGLLGGLLVGLLLAAAPAAAAFVDPPINVSKSPLIPSGSPAIAVNGAGQVFVVWEEGANILFTRSQASCGGLKFEEAPRMLSAGTGTASKPAVAVNDSGGVFVVWQGQQPLANSEVWFNQSTDNGVTFLTDKGFSPVNLSHTTSPSNAPSVAADNFGGVFVAWSDRSPGEILFARSMDSGQSFGSAINVSGTPSNSQAPSVAAGVVAGVRSVFLAWEERFDTTTFSIRYKKFDRSIADLNTVAGLGAPLSTGVPFSKALSPNLAFGDDILSVAFLGVDAVYHRSSSDGTKFSPDVLLAPENLSGAIQFPSNARGARRNHSAMVAWAEELATVDKDIRYRQPGTTMSSPEPVLERAAMRASPAAAIDSTGRLLVAWQGREPADLSNGVTADEVYVSYRGGTGTEPMTASVEMTPQTLNAKTITQGEGVFTLRIRPLDGNAAEIDPLSLQLNDNVNFVTPLRWSLVDTDGNGAPDTLELKIRRSELDSVFSAATLTAAQRDGNSTYTVKGTMTRGRCFSGPVDVRIIH